MKKEELIKHSTAITVASIFLCIPGLVISQESVSYTQMQADSGQRIYEQRCANCHGFNLEGFELAPALAGNLFTRRFGDGSAVDHLVSTLEILKTMLYVDANKSKTSGASSSGA